VKRQKNTTRNNRTSGSYSRFDPGTFKQEKRYLNLASWSLIIEVNKTLYQNPCHMFSSLLWTPVAITHLAADYKPFTVT
jgi:hypothetical protein